MHPILRRTLVGGAVLAGVVAIYRLDSSYPPQAWAFSCLAVSIALGALRELLTLGEVNAPWRGVGMVFGAAWIALLFIQGGGQAPPWELTSDPLAAPLQWTVAALMACSGGCALLLALRIPSGPGPSTQRLAGSCWFSIPYVSGLCSFAWILMHGGLDFVMGLVIVAKASDTGAYFTGKWVGKTPLSLQISPGKTIEGAVGGVLFSGLMALWLLGGQELFEGGPRLPSGIAIVLLGCAVGVIAVISDLSESLLKRSVGKKDSSRLFGEAGGFLDLVDSLLLLAPLAVAYTALAV